MAAGQGQDRGITLGDLATRMAGAIGLDLPSVNRQIAAAEELRALGVTIGRDLKRFVTEGDLVNIGGSVGVAVTSSQPGRAVGRAKTATFVRTIESSLQRAASSAIGAEGGDKEGDIKPSCTGRARRHAHRKGTPASPASPNATAGPCGTTP